MSLTHLANTLSRKSQYRTLKVCTTCCREESSRSECSNMPFSFCFSPLIFCTRTMWFTPVSHVIPSQFTIQTHASLDISPNNILMGASDDSVFSQLEQDELSSPVARKVLTDRTIYMSRPLPRSRGNPILCDLGSARVGHGKHRGDVMPDVYRAPEVILGMEWSSKIDIRSVGVMVSLP